MQATSYAGQRKLIKSSAPVQNFRSRPPDRANQTPDMLMKGSLN